MANDAIKGDLVEAPEFEFIATGVQHMLAISRYKPEVEKSGVTYAWGKNLRGQLGVGNKINQFAPCPIDNAKERFCQVACGQNFSLGLSYTKRVYFWGNSKYLCETGRKDVEEPIVFPELESTDAEQICASYKQGMIITTKGVFKRWGRFLKGEKKKRPKG